MCAKTKKKSAKKPTPLMQQYKRIKEKHPEAILLFRVGDFYETFGSDAEKTAKTLDIVLTKRHNGSAHEIPLAGFPHHALDNYLPRLVKAGFRVAICDQLEEPSKGKKIVRRGVTEVITPGVALNDSILQRKNNHFLAAVHMGKKGYGISFADVSTGEFYAASGNLAFIEKLLRSFAPGETVVLREDRERFAEIFGSEFLTYPLDDWAFERDGAYAKLCQQLKVKSLKGFGLEQDDLAITAAGAVMYYLEQTRKEGLEHIQRIQRIAQDNAMWLDRFTIRNLELIRSPHEDALTLLDVLDTTETAMGGRMLRQWILFPLVDKDAIEQRLSVVDYFVTHQSKTDGLINIFKEVADLERLAAKLSAGKIQPREMVFLRSTLEHIAQLKEHLNDTQEEALDRLIEALDPCPALSQHIATWVVDDAPALLHKQPTIKEGVSEALDEHRHIKKSGKDIILNIQQKEAEAHQIPSLKVGFNNVFGYYLEVRNTHKDKVPEDWIRKQTLTSAERYITPELKEVEQKILSAEDEISRLEEALYRELVEHVNGYLSVLLTNASSLAQLDILSSFAKQAEARSYQRPQINTSLVIDIQEGRHPVIEHQLPPGERYVPNNITLDSEDTQIMMITGPNMSGKSAVLRQTALITLMAQIGSFVPARSARIGIVDKIFTRVGASDNISSGESTFMVEMNETAGIVNNISERSLILLDEIGRGTSTYDGISIAWSVAEYLHNNGHCQPKTLFATHYHELNELAAMYPRIKNYNIATRETQGKVLFLRKLVQGGSRHSFGIHVAEMAGMPKPVLQRARALLKQLEAKRMEEGSTENMAAEIEPQTYQLNMFAAQTDPRWEQLKAELEGLDINRMTPMEAMLKLEALIQQVKE